VENGKKTIRGEESKPVEGERSTGHEYKLRWQKNIGKGEKESNLLPMRGENEKERKGPHLIMQPSKFLSNKKNVKLFSQKKKLFKVTLPDL
jgi:hypothetical protein